MFEFNIFRTGMRSHDRSTWKSGFEPYKKRAGLFGSKSYLVDETSGKFNRFTENMNTMRNEQMDTADKFRVEQQRTWNANNLRDARQYMVGEAFKESLDARAEGSEALSAALSTRRRVASTSEAAAAFNQRLEGFTASRKKLREAQSSLRRARGSDVQFEETGYELLDPGIDQFYEQFDRKLAERRDAYTAEHYGQFGSYDEIQFEDHERPLMGLVSGDWMTETAKQQIDTMVLSDILGQSSYDVYFLGTGGVKDFDIAEVIADTRENFAQLGATSVEQANQMAMAEDESRSKFANIMKRERLKSQAMAEAEGSESIAGQLDEINKAEAAARAKYEEQTAALTEGGYSRKRRVKGVSFTDTRPQ